MLTLTFFGPMFELMFGPIFGPMFELMFGLMFGPTGGLLLLSLAIDSTGLLLALAVQNMLFIAVTLWWMHRTGRSFTQIGLLRVTGRQALLGCVLGIGLFATAQWLGMVQKDELQRLLSAAQFVRLEQLSSKYGAEGEFLRIHSSLLKLLFVISGVILAPLGEECLFRGLVYNVIKSRLGVPVGILASSLIFALLHTPLSMGVIFVIGIALGIVYEKTGSLWVAVVMHSVNNSLAFYWLWTHSG